MNIVDLIKEQHVNDQPTPTEKSQIVIYWVHPSPNLVARFNSLKKGERAYDKLKKEWSTWRTAMLEGAKKFPPQLVDIDGDMFITTIDLSQIAAINFIDHAKRAKFIPQ